MGAEKLFRDAVRGREPREWIARLLLHLTPGVGPARYHGLIANFGSACGVLASELPELCKAVGSRQTAEYLRDQRSHQARLSAAARAADCLGAVVLMHEDAGYPSCLLRLSPCPPAIWVKGHLPSLPGVAIVGTRRASGRACKIAAALAEKAARAGRPVVSGGAYGVDAAAHRGALDASGSTVVVLGGGLDRPYPERHIPLFEKAATQGALVSPFPPGTPPVRGGFIARNAVIAALSETVTVVEAPWRSGALGTARIARRLGLTLLAIPGSPGTDELLRQGACPIEWLDDGPGGGSELSLDEAERQVLGALRDLGTASVEGVAARTALSPLEAVAALMTLVVEGHALQEPGGRYRPSYSKGALEEQETGI